MSVIEKAKSIKKKSAGIVIIGIAGGVGLLALYSALKPKTPIIITPEPTPLITDNFDLTEQVNVTQDEITNVVTSISTSTVLKIEQLKKLEAEQYSNSKSTEDEITRLQLEIDSLYNDKSINEKKYNEKLIALTAIKSSIDNLESTKNELYLDYANKTNESNTALYNVSKYQYLEQYLNWWINESLGYERINQLGPIYYNGVKTEYNTNLSAIASLIIREDIQKKLLTANQMYTSLSLSAENARIEYENLQTIITTNTNAYREQKEDCDRFRTDYVTAIEQIIISKESTLTTIKISLDTIKKNIALIIQEIKALGGI